MESHELEYKQVLKEVSIPCPAEKSCIRFTQKDYHQHQHSHQSWDQHHHDHHHHEQHPRAISTIISKWQC
eukprot:4197779-Karenia_brevis.AAC.1